MAQQGQYAQIGQRPKHPGTLADYKRNNAANLRGVSEREIREQWQVMGATRFGVASHASWGGGGTSFDETCPVWRGTQGHEIHVFQNSSVIYTYTILSYHIYYKYF